MIYLIYLGNTILYSSSNASSLNLTGLLFQVSFQRIKSSSVNVLSPCNNSLTSYPFNNNCDLSLYNITVWNKLYITHLFSLINTSFCKARFWEQIVSLEIYWKTVSWLVDNTFFENICYLQSYRCNARALCWKLVKLLTFIYYCDRMFKNNYNLR